MTLDSRLLAQAADGDAQAYESFVGRHREAVWRFVRSLTRDRTAAEDALQETFLSAWRGAISFRGEGPAISWLLSIARHAVLGLKNGHPCGFLSQGLLWIMSVELPQGQSDRL